MEAVETYKGFEIFESDNPWAIKFNTKYYFVYDDRMQYNYTVDDCKDEIDNLLDN